MADTDYEELEKLFHSDLQSLDLQEPSQSGGATSHLPEWLIGIIVLVILLIITFFALVIYSVLKERQKNRASYAGTTSPSAATQGDVEGDKTDNNGIRITGFNHDQPGKDAQQNANGQPAAAGGGGGESTTTTTTKPATNGEAWTLEQEVVSTLQRQQQECGIGGMTGCMNPAFIDDDADESKVKKGGGENEDKGNCKGSSTKSPKQNGKAGTSSNSKSPKNNNSSKTSGKKSAGSAGDSPAKLANGKPVKGQSEVHNLDPEKGEGSGNALTLFSSSEKNKDSETTDEETNVDEVGGQGHATEAEGTSRQLTFPAETTTTTTAVQIHADGAESTSSALDNGQESSTDEKDATDLSTNL